MWNRASLLIILLAGCTEIVDDDPALVDDDPALANGGGSNCDPDDGGDGGDGGEPSCTPMNTDGRAWGVSISALGLLELGPLPDTDVANPSSLLGIAAHLCSSCLTASLSDTVFAVEQHSTVTGDTAANVATATTNELALAIPGLRISATTLQARAATEATFSSLSASAAGSVLQDLEINGIEYLDLHEPQVITITDPILCIPIAEIRILETIRTEEPDRIALTVNALHVVVFDLALTPILDESIDIIIGHAESESSIEACDPQ